MLTNNIVKVINSLINKKHRLKHNLFVVEGVKNVDEVIQSPIQIKHLFYTDDLWPNLFSCEKTKIQEKELKKISFLTTPNKVLALCEIPKSTVNLNPKALSIALDNIRDPGNLGTIIRLADWFGIAQIYCNISSVDLYNPKVIQSSMGSFTRVQVNYVDLKEFLTSYDGHILGAFMDGSSIYQHKLPKDGILVMGNEANGISKEIEQLISDKITIPPFGENPDTESLNVAIATSIIVGEYFSQHNS